MEKQTQDKKTKAAKADETILQKRNTEKMELPPQPERLPAKVELASIKIQAWWRGTLVRRTLLKAALSAWTIQCWWRQTLARLLRRRLQERMDCSLRQIYAAVKLQSWVRMWLTRKHYLHLRNSVLKLQDSRNHDYICKNHSAIQGCYEITGDKIKLEVDIFFETQICRISDCMPFPIKN
ncbi:IQ domain-containing protein F5-like isoform X6 [Peromyscus eremicus]|uniref:IQ domain-containing protein F5-like isoform X6 n=1 Tax=Peromyscus eremicus TaxID=42410 RepID=UPI0027DC5A81|nr:IQ domain-containing protein F5-like isoform X6 [Peromyscus eremicus]